MFDPKISSVVAGSAFVLSVLVGLISGAGLLFALLRALAFGAVFFVIASIAYKLITQFIPELLGDAVGGYAEEDEARNKTGPVGRRVDVSVGDDQDLTYTQTEGGEETTPRHAASGRRISGDDADRASVSEHSGSGPDFFPGNTLDQFTDDGYTGARDAGDTKSQGRGATPALPSALPSALLDEVDALPDLESMSDSFISPIEGEENPRDSPGPAFSKSPGSSVSLDSGGTFDSRELASAIQTVLKRDQKG